VALRSLDEVAPGTVLRPDVAIVGAGPAGITLALALDRLGVSTLLIEGGGRTASIASQARYQGEADTEQGLEYPNLDIPRLRFLGGASNHWAGWCRRLEHNVFQPRPWMGDIEWPFGWDEIGQYYRRAHEICELGRYEYDPAVISDDLALDAWPLRSTHDDFEPIVWRFSPPTRFATRYGPDLETSDVDVALNANLVSIETSGRMVNRLVLVAENDRGERYVEADRTVLACGGLETVRVLLHLAEGGGLDLDQSGWLGRGFMEHPHVDIGTLVLAGSAAPAESTFLRPFLERVADVDGTMVMGGFAPNPEACAEHGLPNMSITLEQRDNTRLAGLGNGEGVRQLIELVGAGSTANVLSLYLRAEQRPVQSSRIELVGQRDDLGLRRIRLDWRVDDRDLANYVTALELLARTLTGSGIGAVHSFGIESRLQHVGGGSHHLGGARMHESPDGGVVDPSGRVHATDNLYVCSSAAFPVSGFSNPTLTIVALALRMAASLGAAG